MGLKWKVQVLGVAFITSLVALNPALARGGKGGRGGNECHAKMVEELNLSAEQKQKLNEIRTEFRKTLPEKRKAMKAAREELQTVLRGSASADEARKKFQDLKQKEDTFTEARFEKVLAIRALLTPEQRQKFKGLDHKNSCHDHGRMGGPAEDSGDNE